MMQNKKLHVLGITGGVGAGKSTVLGYLEKQYGAKVIMCDDVARLLQEPGEACYRAMVDLFGTEVVQEDGRFDRPKLAAKVFADKGLLEKLNAIVHPAVKQYVREAVKNSSEQTLVVIEAALLLEDNYGELCDEIWYIYTSDEVRRERLKASRGYSDERITQMITNQKPDEYFRENCQFIIDNSSDQVEQMQKQMDAGLKERGFLE